MADLDALSQGVRLAGSQDENEAFDWIADACREAGLRVERMVHPALISLPIAARLAIGGEEFAAITHSFSPSASRTGPLALPEQDPAGRIALVRGLASPEAMRELAMREALAAVFLNGRRTHEMILSPVWGSPAPDDLHRYPEIPAASVAGDAERRLLEAAAAGKSLTLKTQVDTGWRDIPLLIADLPGTGDDFVLFSGHVDSWHRGAMDNAAANAAQLEIMRLLAGSPHRRGLRLAFWSGHSQGRYAGSAWYADRHWLDLYAHCVAHINIDSVGGRGATVLSDALAMPETRGVARDVLRDFGVAFEGSFAGRAGDQSFYGIGVPSLFMTLSEQPRTDENAQLAELLGTRHGGLGEWWHTADDLPEAVDPGFLVRDTQVYLAVIRRFLDAPRLPLDIVGSIEDLEAMLLRHRTELRELGEWGELSVRLGVVLDRWRWIQSSPGDDAKADRLMMRAARILVPLRQVQGSRHGQDPALGMGAYPGIPFGATDESGRIALRRGITRVLHALYELQELASVEWSKGNAEGSGPDGI